MSPSGLRWVYAALVATASFLLLFHLDDRYLWSDEAETANLSVAITRFGLPVTDDGKNLLVLNPRKLETNDANVWIFSPWLDEYVAAGSIALFGRTTLAARLPFALIGIGALVLFVWVVYRLRGDAALALTAGALLLGSEMFFLHVRQCRYYAIVVLAQIWLIWAVHLVVAGKRAGGLHVAGALLLQFYCNYVSIPPNIAAYVLVVARPAWRSRDVRVAVLVSGIAFTVLAMPWLVYSDAFGTMIAHTRARSGGLMAYLGEANAHLIPFTVLAIGVVAFAIKRPAAPRAAEVFAWIAIPLQIVIAARMPGVFLRYVLTALPGCALLTAIIIHHVFRATLLRWSAVAVLVCTNWLVLVGHPTRYPLPSFLAEITSDYVDRTEDIVAWLRANARPGDTVYVRDPEFPLVYYTDLRIVDARWRGDPGADWIFSKGATGVAPDRITRMKQETFPGYDAVAVPVHATAWLNSMPEPDKRQPFTVDEMTVFVVHRRR